MLMPCEIAVKCVVPVIRAMITQELIHEYGLKQEETGNLLGITQAAVSQYLRKARGTALDLQQEEEIARLIKEIATVIHDEGTSSMETRSKICNVCETIRKERLMCKPHKRLEPTLNIKQCRTCLT